MNAVAGDQVIARRTFLKGSFGALITPLAAEAQQAGKNVRIGVLSQGFPDPPPGLPLLPPLRVLGWVQGQNVVFPSATKIRGAYYVPNANITFSSSSECWGAFAANRITQNGIAREKIVRLERRRLVLNLEHRPWVSREDAAIVPVESGEQGDLLQSHRFRPAHDQIHVLDRLPGRAFDQIVEGRHDDCAPRDAVFCHADKGHIRAPHMPRLRRFPEGQDMYERFLRVEL